MQTEETHILQFCMLHKCDFNRTHSLPRVILHKSAVIVVKREATHLTDLTDLDLRKASGDNLIKV